MKCPKCGFVSFDHLSECSRCGNELCGIREGLGLSGMKANVPFLLGSLLTTGEGSEGKNRETGRSIGVVGDVREESALNPEPAPVEPVEGTKRPRAEEQQGQTVIELSDADFEDFQIRGGTPDK